MSQRHHCFHWYNQGQSYIIRIEKYSLPKSDVDDDGDDKKEDGHSTSDDSKNTQHVAHYIRLKHR